MVRFFPAVLGAALLLTTTPLAGARAGEHDITGYVVAPEGELALGRIAVLACPADGGDCTSTTLGGPGLFQAYAFRGLPEADYNIYAFRDENGSADLEAGEAGAVYAGVLDTYQGQPTRVRPPRHNVALRLRTYNGTFASLLPGKAADGVTFENAALPVGPRGLAGTWRASDYRGELVGPAGSQSQYTGSRLELGEDGRFRSVDVYHQAGVCRVYVGEGTYAFSAERLRLSVTASSLTDCGDPPAPASSTARTDEELAWRLMFYAESGIYLELVDPAQVSEPPGNWMYAKSYELLSE